MKEGYKKTEWGWIPEEWNVKNLSEIAEICYGKSQKEVEVSDGKYKILGTGGVIGYTNNFLWDKPSVLIGRKGTIDKPQYIEESFWTVDTLFYTKIKDSNLAKWLFYYVNNIDLKKYNEATGVPSLSVGNLNPIKIITPPLKEQQKIAEILSTVDSQIDDTDKLIEKTKELKKGLMQRLLTKGKGHKEFKMTEIGEIPVEWDIKLFGVIVDKIVGGGTPSRKTEEYFTGNIPWASVKDLDGSFYKSDTKEHITDEAIKNSATNLIAEGKVIIATRMGLGRGFINTVPMTINQDLKAIYPKHNVNNQFLMFWFQNRGSEIEAMGKGSTVKGITLEELKSFQIALPPLREQQMIAKILLSVDNEIEEYENKKIKLEELKEGLMQQLLTGKIRVL